MKISELIEELQMLKAKHGDLIVVAQDEEGKYEISDQSEWMIYDGRKEGSELVIRLC